MIIGLTGRNGAGKGEVANILVESGFIYYSLSDVIRETIQNSGKKVTRDELIKTGRQLREEGGPSVLADLILQKLDPEKNYIIDSIRNPAEVQALKRRSDFHLLQVVADQKTRFERTKARQRENDPQTFEEFVRIEDAEAENANPAGQQLNATIALAEFDIPNDASLDELSTITRELLRELAKKKPRPQWDEYFMGIAKVVALRSNCIKRKVAAVIVKDKRIISTGYNGTPRGIENCNEGGCPRCYSFGASGQGLTECLCSHAEENAIVQAAYHGVSLKDATLYTTFSPCLLCTKMILNSGIKEIVYNAKYPMGELSFTLLKKAYLQVRNVS